MGLFTNLILSLIHVLLIAIDLMLFFLLAKILTYKWQNSLLTAFNSVGKPVVDWFTNYLEKGVHHLSSKTYSQKMLLVIGMLVLMFARLMLVALFCE